IRHVCHLHPRPPGPRLPGRPEGARPRGVPLGDILLNRSTVQNSTGLPGVWATARATHETSSATRSAVRCTSVNPPPTPCAMLLVGQAADCLLRSQNLTGPVFSFWSRQPDGRGITEEG